MAQLDDSLVYYGDIKEDDARAVANAPANIKSQATNRFKSELLDRVGLSVQAFEHSRATMAGVNGRAFAKARDAVFQKMVDNIGDVAVKHMNDLVSFATDEKLVDLLGDNATLEDVKDMRAVGIRPGRFPRGVAEKFAENYIRGVTQALMDNLEIVFPSEMVNYSILNVKRGDEAERPIIPRK